MGIAAEHSLSVSGVAADTIAAISTAAVPAARAVVRTSGPLALATAASISGREALRAGVLRTSLRFAGLVCPGYVYTSVAPRSYTGEDSAEYHLPGNLVLAQLLLRHLFEAGLRGAEPGEFTSRAYLNGRLDLTAAEGVALAVSAQSEQELLSARRLMSGELARRVMPVMDRLADTVALLEAGIDFADEGISVLPLPQLLSEMSVVRSELKALRDDAPRLERLSHEPTVVLVGRPNAGKSSLLNALSGQMRAIASPVAGTTRDVLSVEVALKRGMVRLLDVAGLDAAPVNSQSAAEQIASDMQSAARRAIEEADHLVVVHAADDPQSPLVAPRSPALMILNKVDLATGGADSSAIAVSALNGQGLDVLRDRLDEVAFGPHAVDATHRLALNARHLDAIARALESLDQAEAIADGAPELVAAELRDALDAIGTVIGRLTPDDLLGRVFARFCIGK